MKLVFITLLLFLGSVFSMKGQDVLEQYIAEGLENNLSLQQQELEIQKAIAALDEAKGLFLPNMQFDSDYTLARGGRLINIPVGDLLNPVYSSLNELTASNAFPTIENVNEPFFLNNFHDTRVTVALPLFNTDIYFGYKARKALRSVEEVKIKTFEQALIEDIKIAFYQLMQTYDAIDILESNKELIEELIQLNEALVENSIVTIDAVYKAQAELAKIESELAITHAQHISAVAYFNFLLNRSIDAEVEKMNLSTLPAMQETSMENLQRRAIMGRTEIKQANYGKEATKQQYQLDKASYLPKASVAYLNGFQGFDYRFTGQEDYQLVQFNISLPIFTGFQRKHRAEQSKLQLKNVDLQIQQLEQQIAMQVIQTKANYDASVRSYYGSLTELEWAEKAYKIKKNQYEEGQLLLVDFLDAQTQFIQAQKNKSIKLNEVWIAHAKLDRVLAL